MKKLFSFRLYAEGLKILRLPGFTTGIIITLLMCADPIIKRFEFGEPCDCGSPHMHILTMSQFALPLLLLLLVTPFFIFRVFSFLNKRSLFLHRFLFIKFEYLRFSLPKELFRRRPQDKPS